MEGSCPVLEGGGRRVDLGCCEAIRAAGPAAWGPSGPGRVLPASAGRGRLGHALFIGSPRRFLPPRGLRDARRSGSAEPSQYCGSFANDGCSEAGGAASGGGGGAGAGGERSRVGARRGLVQGEGRACSIRLYVQAFSFHPSSQPALGNIWLGRVRYRGRDDEQGRPGPHPIKTSSPSGQEDRSKSKQTIPIVPGKRALYKRTPRARWNREGF